MILRIAFLFLLPHIATCFVFQSVTSRGRGVVPLSRLSHQFDDSADFISLGDCNGAVQKIIIEEGTGDVPAIGSEVVIDYVGTLIEDEWSVDDVVESWLTTQQGFADDETILDAFRKHNIDGSKLFDESFFTDEFVSTELGIDNKIKCKKLVMAARRLGKERAEIQYGTEFDSSRDRGSYKFKLGPKGKAIKAMDMTVSTMKVGETCLMVCRSDYAYGPEGLRKPNGDVVIPPYATLSFEIQLLEDNK